MSESWNIVLRSWVGIRTRSPKTDIYKPKTSNLIDAENTSDSEETLVYESNPPEAPSDRPSRCNLRSPGANTKASRTD